MLAKDWLLPSTCQPCKTTLVELRNILADFYPSYLSRKWRDPPAAPLTAGEGGSLLLLSPDDKVAMLFVSIVEDLVALRYETLLC